ncbi:MAG: polymer-forming cytoskeletal protein [Candidatus Tectomicrobia bacterium]|uniref:Polymer-forming cytoskeletal protein n=1 Tax=Tectimicrobiota bacterium TaxID=2528274 RepID=A0A932GQ53_UNCTE|nr:polymer-forming cytoskeletal protein [Candidatus Tectomicrobia bacterium]
MGLKSVGKKEGANRETLRAFLGEGTQFHGILSFQGTVRVDGKFEGEILSPDTFIVGESAEVRAEINVGTLIGCGKISGNVRARHRIEIQKGSVLLGDVSTPILVVEEGAVYEGHCRMTALDAERSQDAEGREPDRVFAPVPPYNLSQQDNQKI